MYAVIQGLAPIFLLILLGHLLRRFDFPGQGFWPLAERLTYYLLLPALLVDKVVSAELAGQPVGRMALAMGLAVCVLALSALLVRRRLGVQGPGFTSVFQGMIRPNTYVGLSAAWVLQGRQGLALSAVAIMALVPLVNVLSVAVLSHFGERTRASGMAATIMELVRNPLILAVLAGFFLRGLDVSLPYTVNEILSLLGGASLPVGLLAVGAGLRFAELTRNRLAMVAAGTGKLLILPAVTAGTCLALGVAGEPLVTALIFTCIPVSVSSFILARQLGGDHRLMAAVITLQTVAAALTMPLVLTLGLALAR